MQCKRAFVLKVSSALVLHTGNVEMFRSGLPLRVGDQPLPLCTPTVLGRTPTRHPELLSTAFPGKDPACSGLPRESLHLDRPACPPGCGDGHHGGCRCAGGSYASPPLR